MVLAESAYNILPAKHMDISSHVVLDGHLGQAIISTVPQLDLYPDGLSRYFHSKGQATHAWNATSPTPAQLITFASRGVLIIISSRQ
jgi:hypothetical protein